MNSGRIDLMDADDEHVEQMFVDHLAATDELETNSQLWQKALKEAGEMERELRRRGYEEEDFDEIIQTSEKL